MRALRRTWREGEPERLERKFPWGNREGRRSPRLEGESWTRPRLAEERTPGGGRERVASWTGVEEDRANGKEGTERDRLGGKGRALGVMGGKEDP